MELYPGYLQDHFNIHKLSRLSPQQPLATSGGGPGRYVVTSPPVVVPGTATAMGIYERQQRHHLVAAGGVWGPDPFLRPDAADMAMPMPMPMVPQLMAAVPTVTVATSPPLPVHGGVELEDVKFGKRLLQAQQDDFVGVPASMGGGGGGEAAPPSSESFGGHDEDDDDYATARPPPRDSKSQRRLAQNREAARKSRLRKKAYIQNLETSRMKLAQLEQELTMARRHHQVQHASYGMVAGLAVAAPPPAPPPVDPRIAAFEQEYSHWVEEQERQAAELRAALLQSSSPPADDLHLGVLVDAAVAHYGSLFESKARAARCDAFYVLSGVWRAPADRFFLWIGGFRPSDLLDVLAPHLGPLEDHQAAQVGKLRNTARQLEDALAQGLEKLQQTLLETLLLFTVDDDGGVEEDGGGHAGQRRRREMEGAAAAAAVGKLGGLVDFVEKADHIRQQTLRNMRRILTPWQAARGVLALAEYGQRLRALSSLWAARPREPA